MKIDTAKNKYNLNIKLFMKTNFILTNKLYVLDLISKSKSKLNSYKNYSTDSCNQKDFIPNTILNTISDDSFSNTLPKKIDLPVKSSIRDVNNTNYLYFLAGFVEGEGSNTVSITVNENFKYGVSIKPEFNVYFIFVLIVFLTFKLENFYIIGNYNLSILWIVLNPIFPIKTLKFSPMFYSTETELNLEDTITQKDNSNYTPLKIYDNANIDKKAILNDFKGKSGVYCWTNKLNGFKYIGSALEFRGRLSSYYNKTHLKSKKTSKIFTSLNKYGFDNFKFEIIEICDSTIRIEREQFYINSVNPTLNILRIAGSSQGHRHSPETKLRMINSALNRSLEDKQKLLNRLTSTEWQIQNLEHLKKLNSSEKHLKHISLLGKSSGHPITILDINTKIKTTFNSNVEASKFIGCSDMTIIRAKRKILAGKEVLIKKRYKLIL